MRKLINLVFAAALMILATVAVRPVAALDNGSDPVYNLTIAKTALTGFTRTWDWSIVKTSTTGALNLAIGESAVVPYSVTVTASGPVDSGWFVYGVITVTNNTPVDAEITGVMDIIGLDVVTVNCPVSFPYILPAGEKLECTYNQAVASAAAGRNTAKVTVSTTGKVGGALVQVPFTFGEPTTKVNECITVNDDKFGSLGQVCATESPKTFEYNQTVGPFDTCGVYEFTNTAMIVENGKTSSVTIPVDVACKVETGCTLTQGYWKTHSVYGPASKPNATWNLVGGPDALFKNSGMSWYSVFHTSPAGNPYYILAHQYMAATLNKLSGAASTAEVDTALAAAESYLTLSPATKWTKDQKAVMTTLAGLLDGYNNGLTGPGHCSE